jgi:phosphomannomutase
MFDCFAIHMAALKIGISGVRGIVGQTFTPELAVGFAQAFGTYLDSKRILVCRDTRPSGPMVASAVISGLLASGCEVIDLGVCPTPSMQLAVGRLNADGGISITAGHNPAAWNALKFVRGDGLYLNVAQAEELLDIYHQGEFAKADWRRIHASIRAADAVPHHVAVLSSSFDMEAIRTRRPRVALDCCNGSCSLLTPGWLTAAGCDVVAINDDPSSPFPHAPEPRLDTMAQVAALVKAGGADIGFVHDSDGERLGIVDECGRPVSEEMTVVLAIEIALQRRAGPVVVNVSTTGAVERVAARHGVPVVRTPVGQPWVSEAIVEHKAVIGGEGNGSVVLPAIHPTPDGPAAIGLILEHIAKSGSPVSALIDKLPRIVMIKERFAVDPRLVYSALQHFRRGLKNGNGVAVDLGDGIKVQWPDGWAHVRASNTQSIVRLIVEAEDEARANEILDWAHARLRRSGIGESGTLPALREL